MPSRVFDDWRDSSTFPKSNSLKAHKALPRRRVLFDNSVPTREDLIIQQSRNTEEDRDVSAPSAASIPRLPLTPPSTEREIEVKALNDNHTSPPSTVIPTRRSSELSTPVNAFNLPTPEYTPPKKESRPMHLVPSPLSTRSSSRAESFRTARERFSSDDEGEESPILPRMSFASRLGPGFGIEWDIEDSDRTPTIQTPSVLLRFDEHKTPKGHLNKHHTETKQQSNSQMEGAEQSELAIIQNSVQRDQSLKQQSESPSSIREDLDLPFSRGFSLRERVRHDRNRKSLPNGSVEQFARQIEWPDDNGGNEVESKLSQVDNRRLSQMSTVVEAVVLDAPTQRRQVLRHMGKTASLRAASSPTNGSKRSSLISNDSKPRLVHRNIRLMERGNRFSLTSESTGSDPAIFLLSKIPVVAAPSNPSPITGSLPSRKRHSGEPTPPKVIEPDLWRPNTAPDSLQGYFDTSNSRSRTTSPRETVTLMADKEHRADRPSAAVARSSPVSAPTSRNASQNASLTSASLHTHNEEQAAIELQSASNHAAPARPHTPADVAAKLHGEDWTGSRYRSTLTTPFSMLSMNSSTPGTLEVNQATAVNIYSHNNESVLVVQQNARPNVELPETAIASVDESNPAPVISELISQLAPREDSPIQLFDSLLINPRSPPKLPTLKLVPPTPAILTPTTSKEPQLEDGTSVNISGTRFAMVRRALSARRYSESFVSPLKRSLQRGTTTANRRQSVDKQSDSKLSPFWRPRGFWDDFSDSESDFGNDAFLVNDTLGLPRKRSISGPASLKRRLGSLRLKRRPPQSQQAKGLRREASNESMGSYHFVQKEKKGGIMPRLGYPVQFVGLTSLRDGFERRKVRREEGRRERERVRLRESIGPVILREDVGFGY